MVTIEIRPELAVLIQERLQNGAFHNVDELLTKALEALPTNGEHPASLKPRKPLLDVLMSRPFAGSDLEIERLKEYPPPPVDL